MKQIDVKFKEEGYKIYKYAGGIANTAILLLALTSSLVIYSKSDHFLSEWISNDGIRFCVSAAIVYIIIRAVDMGLFHFLLFAFLELLSGIDKKEERHRYRFMIACICIVILQAFTTSAFTYFGAEDIGEATTSQVIFDDYQSISETRATQFNTAIAAFDESIKEAQKSKKRRLATAKAQGAEKILSAINSQGKKMATLYHSPTDRWAKIQLKEVVEKAKADSAGLVQLEETRLENLIAEKKEFVASQSQNDNQLLNPIAAHKSGEIAAYNAKKSRTTGYLRYAAFFLVIVFGICTYLQALYIVSTQDKKYDTTKTLSFTEMSQKLLKEKYQSLLQWLDKNTGGKNLTFVADSGGVESSSVGTKKLAERSNFKVSNSFSPASKPTTKKAKGEFSHKVERRARTTRQNPKPTENKWDKKPNVVYRNTIWVLVENLNNGKERYSTLTTLKERIRKDKQRLKVKMEESTVKSNDHRLKASIRTTKKRIQFLEKAKSIIEQKILI